MKNIGEAFSFPFRDPNWMSKFIIGALFGLLSFLVIGIPVLYGYYIELCQRVRRREQYPMPEWNDIGVKFVLGFKYCIALLVYCLPVFLVLIPALFIVMVAAVSGSPAGGMLGSAVFLALIFFFIVPYSLLITLLTPVITLEFTERGSIADALRLGRVFRLARSQWQNTLVAALIGLGVGVLSGVGLILLIVGIFLTDFYAKLITFHLYGQIGQLVDESRRARTAP